MQMSKEEYARKRIHNSSSVLLENSVTQVTVRHHSASLMTEVSSNTSQPLKILILCHKGHTACWKMEPSYIFFFLLTIPSTVKFKAYLKQKCWRLKSCFNASDLQEPRTSLDLPAPFTLSVRVRQTKQKLVKQTFTSWNTNQCLKFDWCLTNYLQRLFA